MLEGVRYDTICLFNNHKYIHIHLQLQKDNIYVCTVRNRVTAHRGGFRACDGWIQSKKKIASVFLIFVC